MWQISNKKMMNKPAKSSMDLSKGQIIRKDLRRNWIIYLMALPVIAYYMIFHYGPMYGLQIAFKDYSPAGGIWGSPWVGFKHFDSFF